MIEAWSRWESARNPAWPTSDHAVSRGGLGSSEAAEMGFSCKPLDAAALQAGWACRSCAFDKNSATASKCTVCQKGIPKWTCERCSTKNKVSGLAIEYCRLQFGGGASLLRKIAFRTPVLIPVIVNPFEFLKERKCMQQCILNSAVSIWG